MTIDADAEFAALVQRQSRFVFRVAYAVLLNAYDAEDAVQETFLKLYRNRGWQHLKNERAFLARVTWRVAVDLSRHSLRHSASRVDTVETGEAASPHAGPEQALLLADQRTIVHSMIDALPEELRVPLVLSSFDELNSRQIGDILGVPEGTIRTRLQRARQILHQKLDAIQARSAESRHA